MTIEHSLRSAAVCIFALAACASPASSESASSPSGDTVSAKRLAFASGTLPLRGTALSGAEFGPALPGIYGTDYTFPTTAEVDYFIGKGMTAFRIGFQWERLQPTAYGDFDAAYLARLDAIVFYATAHGANAILDPHNFARYYDEIVGVDVPADVLSDFWGKAAAHYGADARVVFGLMNEPHDMPTEAWVADANASLVAIRNAGATNLVLVPGNAWTGAHAWAKNDYGTSNAVAMLAIRDPGDNYAFEVHQYLDADFSGVASSCQSTTIGATSMTDFTDWLRANGKRGFLGELGAAYNATCVGAIDAQLAFVEANADLYLGWTWWAAGPWWGAYPMSIEPDGTDKPMMGVLAPHLL